MDINRTDPTPHGDLAQTMRTYRRELGVRVSEMPLELYHYESGAVLKKLTERERTAVRGRHARAAETIAARKTFL